MRVAIVSNTDNGKGLQRDAQIVGDVLRKLGHAVTEVHFQRARTPPRHAYDLAIFLEVGGKREARFHAIAPRLWLVPNPEWWEPTDDLSIFDRILCKTQDAERIFRGLAPDPDRRVGFIGFTSQDAWPDAPEVIPTRDRTALHIAGGSTMKGTQAVLDAWGSDPSLPQLAVCTSIPESFRWPRGARNVVNAGRPSASTLAAMQRQTRVHVQPSEYEGFGHVLHEGRSARSVVVTTSSAPMNEIAGVLPIVHAHQTVPLKSARIWRVSPAAVLSAVRRAFDMSDAAAGEIGRNARAAWEADRESFVAALAFEMERIQ